MAPRRRRRHRRRRSALSLGIALVVASVQIELSKADQPVNCSNSTKWMDNEAHRSPCTIALLLMLQCSSDLTISPLNSSVNTYENPLQGQWCTCNTVVYNLMSACAICQDGTPTNFTTWTDSCSDVTHEYPDVAIAESYNTPRWAYVNTTELGTFNLAAAEEAAGVDKGWSTLQIVLPIIIGVVVALIAVILFLLYRRRLKRRYAPLGGTYPSRSMHISQDSRIYSQQSIPHSRPGHHHAASSSTLGVNSLTGQNGSVPARTKSRATVAWERARMAAPRKLGGLLPDRRKVHERTRGADWSIDVDPPGSAEQSIDPWHSKMSTSSSSGSGGGSHSKEASGKSSRPSGHGRSESRLGLLSDGSPERLNPIQDSPDLIKEQNGFVQGFVNGLTGLGHGIRMGRRTRPVPVLSSPPRRGFKMDDVDSASSPTDTRNVRNSRFESFRFAEADEDGDHLEVGPSTSVTVLPSGAGTSLNVAVSNEVPSSLNPSQSGSRPRSDGTANINVNESGSGSDSRIEERRERGRQGDVVIISRIPGQDFNSNVSPVTTDGLGCFAASSEIGNWPAAQSDTSSILQPSYHRPGPIPPAPPPTQQTPSSAYSPSHSPSGTPRPPSRILIPLGNGNSQLLVPNAVRAAGGYRPTNPQRPGPGSAFSPQQLTSAGTTTTHSLLPNARLFSGSVAESVIPEPPSAISPGVLTNDGIPPESEHSSEAYTVPNPFIFDQQHGGGAGAANALRLASPPRSRSRAEVIE